MKPVIVSLPKNRYAEDQFLFFRFYFFLLEKDFVLFFFFFQAEDGIRDLYVTGVQTCALPICVRRRPLGATELRRGDGQHPEGARPHRRVRDRKSTRLNSSHVEISYAVFC